jgi:transposase InsO family protein
VTDELRDEGWRVSENTVAALMAELGLAGRVKKRRRSLTRQGKRPAAPDRVRRQFTAPAPNVLWCGDLTEIDTDGQALPRHGAGPVQPPAARLRDERAPRRRTGRRLAAHGRRHPGRRHRGRDLPQRPRSGQYTSIRFTEHLELEGISPSIGSVGDAFDNALMETFNGLYKAECIRTTVFHDGPYRTIADVEYAPPAGSTGTTTDGSTAPLA